MPTGARRMLALVLLDLVARSCAIQQVQASGSADFAVSLPAPPKKNGPISKVLGWQLTVESDETPVTLGKIRGHGSVADWNLAHPDQSIAPGDQVVEVNGVKWNGDTRAFEAALGKEIQATMRAPLRLLRLTVQRRKLAEQAAKAQEQETEQMIEATAQRSNIQRVEVEEKATISADIQEKTQIGEEKANGSTDVQATGSNLLEERPTLTAEAQAELSISKVEGLIAAWNKLHPEDPIELDQEKFRKAMSESLVSRDVV
mmetsp:Transcript_27857/g.63146  ORF Transcript_27857/g.63146 Transcript_27857/m.63146 type:complete len:259 (+) Transcript_27857:78-854(+)